jgi:hypothetical protein
LRSPLWLPVRSVMGVTGGTRKGCPYRVALVVARAVGHGCHPRCHRGHPPVGATLAVALVVARAVSHGCHRGHPQGVPLRGRPWDCGRPCGRSWVSPAVSSGAPAVSFWAPARGAPTGSPMGLRSTVGCGRPYSRSWVSSGASAVSFWAPARGAPTGSPIGLRSPVQSVMGVIGGTCDVILGTRKGCPYRVARAVATTRRRKQLVDRVTQSARVCSRPQSGGLHHMNS